MSDSSRTVTLNGNPLALDGPELHPGDPAPDFEAYDLKLQPVHLDQTGSKVRIFSVVPSLDTPVCDAQTKRFNEEAAKLPNVDVGQGWLIFGLPPAEVAVHPGDKNDVHELYLMCEDVAVFIEELRKRNASGA